MRYTLVDKRIPRERLRASNALATWAENQADGDTTTASESQQQGARNDLTNDDYASDSSPQDAEYMSIEGQFKILEDMVAQKLKTDLSVATVLTLEERIRRLEERLTKDLRVGNRSVVVPKGPGAVLGLETAYIGSSQTPYPKSSNGSIKAQQNIAIAAIAVATCTFMMSGGLKEQRSIATAAIAVALCTLIISLGQILTQYRATTEGYWRCQYSVTGPWAKRTRLRW